LRSEELYNIGAILPILRAHNLDKACPTCQL
jgi:hypothetical protein